MVFGVLLAGLVLVSGAAAEMVDLRDAAIVVRPGDIPRVERTAATVLAEEVEARTGIAWPVSESWPSGKPVIAITAGDLPPAWGKAPAPREGTGLPESRPEGYRLYVESGTPPVVWIAGADARGALYGVGALLRHLDWDQGSVKLDTTLDIATAPAYPIRGHQLGYRAQANSYDAWDVATYDQYIREMALFGANAVENIPFQDDRETPVMRVPRDEMNVAMSEICQRYGMDYWIWTPAEFHLSDTEKREALLDQHEALFRDAPVMTGVFFPGGDPGQNPPEYVLPYLEDMAERLLKYHPEGRIWLSLQWFNREQIETVLDYMKAEPRPWFEGLVGGPSSPPVALTRLALPEQYKYRLYPDITHNKICQYPVPWWDQAYALTLGREAINPRPAQYAYIHNWFAPYSDGFISYSDGAHDNVNKTIYSVLGWDPATPVREILVQYTRLFFHPEVAEDAADGILALEKNWRGPLIDNGAVDGTLLFWQDLETRYPALENNWRWQMMLVRAYYDAYIRRRLVNETRLETEANAILAQAPELGPGAAMDQAMDVLNRAVEEPVATELRARIYDLCEKLYHSIGLQTSVEKYHAIGAERGAFLDFVDYPLNNRWWLEDEFERIRAYATEAEKLARLDTIAHWETPGFGSYYDDVGNPAKSPHVKRAEFIFTEPGEEAHPEPILWWWDNGMSRARLSWQSSMNFPEAVVYEGLDKGATYTIRLTGYGKSLLRIDGERVMPTLDGTEMGAFKEFPVDAKFLDDRKLVLTWDRPTDEGHLNWRQHSRLAEIWLLRQ